MDIWQKAVTLLVLFSIVMPKTAVPQDELTKGQMPPTRDVALADGGVLTGRVLDAQGGPRQKCLVSVCLPHGVVAAAETDTNGLFSIRNLRGGAYAIKTEKVTDVYRLWAPSTAPPAAQNCLTIATGPTIRGQDPSDLTFQSLVAFAMIGGIVTAVVLGQNDDAS
jgi:hypothetical protein